MPQIKGEIGSRPCWIVRQSQKHWSRSEWVVGRIKHGGLPLRLGAKIFEGVLKLSCAAPMANSLWHRILGPRPLLHIREAPGQRPCFLEPNPITSTLQVGHVEPLTILAHDTVCQHSKRIFRDKFQNVAQSLLVFSHLW